MPLPPPLRTQELLVGFAKFKRRSIDLEKNYRRKPNVVDFGASDDVTGQIKVEMFDDFEYLVLSRTRAVCYGNKSIQRRG